MGRMRIENVWSVRTVDDISVLTISGSGPSGWSEKNDLGRERQKKLRISGWSEASWLEVTRTAAASIITAASC